MFNLHICIFRNTLLFLKFLRFISDKRKNKQQVHHAPGGGSVIFFLVPKELELGDALSPWLKKKRKMTVHTVGYH